jgi:hypothetical protein
MLFAKVQSWSRREQKWKQEEITNLLGVKSAISWEKANARIESVLTIQSWNRCSFLQLRVLFLHLKNDIRLLITLVVVALIASDMFWMDYNWLLFSLFHYANNSATIKFVFVVWRLLTWVPIKLKLLSEELIVFARSDGRLNLLMKGVCSSGVCLLYVAQ